MNSPEGYTRREFLGKMGKVAASIGMTVLLNGCDVSKIISLESERSEWEKLPPIKKLERLIEGDYPKIDDFDSESEAKNATILAYCQQTKCNISPENMAKDIHYVDQGWFLVRASDEILRHGNPQTATISTGFGFTNSIGEIYINRESIKEFDIEAFNEIFLKKPKIMKQIDEKKLKMLLQITVQAHEMTHLNTFYNANKKAIRIDEFFMFDPRIEDTVYFFALDGFDLIGETQQNNYYYRILGGDEAITDLAAYIIVEKKMGITYFRHRKYHSLMVDKLNSTAGVTDEQFLKYASGELSSTELFEKWGSLKKDANISELAAGILAFKEIALSVSNLTSPEDAQNQLQQILNVSFK